MTDERDNEPSVETAIARLAEWRRRGGIPPEAFGSRVVLWRQLTSAERAVWQDAWGVPRFVRSTNPTNPGGSVGGSYGNVR